MRPELIAHKIHCLRDAKRRCEEAGRPEMATIWERHAVKLEVKLAEIAKQ